MYDPAEQPWGFIAAAAIAALVLVIYKAARPQKRTLKYWVIPLLLVLCGFAVDHIIKTDKEKIYGTISGSLKAAQQENTEELGKFLAENYSDSIHPSKSAIMAYCRDKLTKPQISRNYKNILSLEVTGSDAVVMITVRIVFDEDGSIYRAFEKKMLTVEAGVYLNRDSSGHWLINRVELLKIDNHFVDWRNVREALNF